jgi:hypothetical protein
MMNGAAGLPMMSACQWFSITTITVCTGRGTTADGPPDADGGAAPFPADGLVVAGVTAEGRAGLLTGPEPSQLASASNAADAATECERADYGTQ